MLAFSNLLVELETGEVQTVGNMEIIPLVSAVSHAISNAGELTVKSEKYGEITLRNNQAVPSLYPSNTVIYTKQAVQDHVIISPVIVEATQKVKTAACVQRTTPGHIFEGVYELRSLPIALRQAAYSKRNEISYSKLWEDISAFEKKVNLPSNGDMEVFFKEYEKQLSVFNATFEPIENQVGFICLVGGVIVGLERFPNPEYFLGMFDTLLREAYGSYAMLSSKSGLTPIRKQMAVVDTLEALEAELKKVEDEESRIVRDSLNQLLNTTLEVTLESLVPTGYKTYYLDSEDFVGSYISLVNNSAPVYVSLTRTNQSLQKVKLPAFNIKNL